MFRIIRVPAVLDKCFGPLRPHFHWDHWRYFRLLGLAMACLWGRRHVTNLYRYLEVEPHRTRVNNFFLVKRWDPEAALRQKAQAWLRALRPDKGETLYWIIEPWLQDVKPWLGLGHDQHRSSWAAVIHLRIERTGAPGQRTRHKAADLSTAAAQDQLRNLLWEDLLTYRQEECPDQPVIEALERLRIA